MPTVETLQKEATWLIFLFPDILSAVTLKLLGFQMSISPGYRAPSSSLRDGPLGKRKEKAFFQVGEILEFTHIYIYMYIYMYIYICIYIYIHIYIYHIHVSDSLHPSLYSSIFLDP